MSRNSVFRYKGRETDAQAAGQTLKVQAVLTGRVVQRGDGLSISAELIDVRNNRHLWGEQYNRKLLDILAVQGDGEEVVIKRHGRAVAQLVPVRRHRPSALGAMRGEFEMVEGWERALTDEEAEAFWSGR